MNTLISKTCCYHSGRQVTAEWEIFFINLKISLYFFCIINSHLVEFSCLKFRIRQRIVPLNQISRTTNKQDYRKETLPTVVERVSWWRHILLTVISFLVLWLFVNKEQLAYTFTMSIELYRSKYIYNQIILTLYSPSYYITYIDTGIVL